MTPCVTETSYYLIFATALVVSMLLLIVCAYSYDKFKTYTETPDEATDKNLNSAINISLSFFVAGILGILTLFVMFFGFQTRMVGVHTTISR